MGDSLAQILDCEIHMPIFLPKNHTFFKFIVEYYHERKGQEIGVNFTLNYWQGHYLVAQGRQQVRRYIEECGERNSRYRVCPHDSRGHHYLDFFRDDSESICHMCNRFRGTFLHPVTTRQSLDEALQTLFPLRNRNFPGDVFLNVPTKWPKLMLSDDGRNYVEAAREIKERVESMMSTLIE